MKVGSLFTGIGGFDLGFERAGMECAWQVEIDKDCNRVLGRQFPKVKRFDDVTTVRAFSAVDVICGGFPCQDLSVAGKRAGLAGERSGLWFEFLRIINSNQPRWIVIENVPGLLSSDEGRDFAAILRGLVNIGYCLAWRVLDAQYFGVAQRRRRVFIVGSLGNGSAAQVLFESESVSGNPPSRGEARAGIAEVSVRRAQTSSNGWGVRTDESTGTLDGTGGDAVIGANCLTPWDVQTKRIHSSDGLAPSLASSNGQGGQRVPYVTHALRSEGADASEDGTGRGTPLVVADTLGTSANRVTGKYGDLCPIAFSSKDHGADAGNIAPTLRSQNFKDSHMNGGGQVAIAFAQNSRDEVRIQGDGNISGALASEPGMKQTTYLAFHENKSGQLSEADVLGLRSGASHSYQGIGGNFGVRRLTPRECERLQGFPDDYTRWDAEGKEISDSARYRMLGNAVEVDCAKWIGKRLISTQA